MVQPQTRPRPRHRPLRLLHRRHLLAPHHQQALHRPTRPLGPPHHRPHLRPHAPNRLLPRQGAHRRRRPRHQGPPDKVLLRGEHPPRRL